MNVVHCMPTKSEVTVFQIVDTLNMYVGKYMNKLMNRTKWLNLIVPVPTYSNKESVNEATNESHDRALKEIGNSDFRTKEVVL